MKKLFYFTLLLICLTTYFFYAKLTIKEKDYLECQKKNDEFAKTCENTVKLKDTEIKQLKSVINNEKLPSTVILNIPHYKQKYTASCEFAAVHSAMKYFGVDVSEDQLISDIGQDKKTERYLDAEGNLHWGNPQVKFVGDVNAKVVYIDGYGVYNEPIYKVLTKYKFGNSISKKNWDIEELFQYIRKGYPAIAWISNDFKAKKVITLIAPDGSKHKWIDKEHAVVIKGVDKSNVYIMDVGRKNGEYKVSISKFETGFKNLDNMAIVVIPDE